MPKREQQSQSNEQWFLQFDGKSQLCSSKQEAIEILVDSDVTAVTLRRVPNIQEDNAVQSCEQDASTNAYHVSSTQHLQLDNSIDLDLLHFEDDLEDIALDDSMMNEMHEKIDWHEACYTFLKNIMTPKKEKMCNNDIRRNSPIANLFLRREDPSP